MKRLVLVLAVAGAVLLAAGAYAAVSNMAVGAYKNMAGSPYPETMTGMVTANLVGPVINMSKSQQNMRTSQSGPTIMIASGDSIQYTISFTNDGSDSATQLVITDTLAFDTVPGQTIQYVISSASPDNGSSIAGGNVVLEYFNGTWISSSSAAIPATAKGIRWTIDAVQVGGPYNLNFTVIVTSP